MLSSNTRRWLAPQPWVLPRPAGRALPAVYSRFRQLPPPVIVIGMHRSGTSIVSEMLAALGLYMGWQLSHHGTALGLSPADNRMGHTGNGEAPEFLALNTRFLRAAGGEWDDIEPYLRRRDEAEFAHACVRAAQWATFGSLRTGFLSPLPRSFQGAWGWKDPRNSLTLPVWLRLFPDARILHVRREIAGVVASLHRRAHGWTEAPPAPPDLAERLRSLGRDPKKAARYLGRRLGLLPPAAPARERCLDPHVCARLTLEYQHQCFRLRERGACYLEVRYEQLLADPLAAARDMAVFAGVPAEPEDLLRAARLVRRAERRPES